MVSHPTFELSWGWVGVVTKAFCQTLTLEIVSVMMKGCTTFSTSDECSGLLSLFISNFKHEVLNCTKPDWFCKKTAFCAPYLFPIEQSKQICHFWQEWKSVVLKFWIGSVSYISVSQPKFTPPICWPYIAVTMNFINRVIALIVTTKLVVTRVIKIRKHCKQAWQTKMKIEERFY